MDQTFFKKITDWFLCILCAGMLILAFPRTDVWILAWGGLVPLLFVLDGKKPWAAFRAAYACGFLFFTGTLYWFFNVSRWFSYIAVVGVLLLLMYLALYFGLFGLCYSLFSRRNAAHKLLLLPSVWVTLEFARSYLFTGFDWVSLGQSQYRNLILIQIADVTGMFGVSFIVVMVNVLLKEFITAYFIRKTEDQRTLSVLIWITSAVMAIVLGYGAYRLSPSKDDKQAASQLTVAVIQPNIPQDLKWQESAKTLIIGKNIALSKRAAENEPDLIIWPETSYPDYLWEERELFGQVQLFVRRLDIPVLLGSVVKEENDYYNTSILLSGTGEAAEIYRKTHLVPFGEFVPLRRFLPFLSNLIDIGDFTRGKTKTVFRFLTKDQKQGRFSVLICFEDTVARLSRQFVQGGAQWLVNITNDAWFGNTKAPFMHLQSAVFRAVENRRALVRAANTGVSCFVDRFGKIDNYVKGQGDRSSLRTYISGYALGKVSLNTEETFYTKFGDVFAFLCFGCILMGIVIIVIDKRRMSSNTKINIIGRE